MFKHMTLVKKIGLSYLVMLGLILAVGLVGWQTSVHMLASFEHVVADHLDTAVQLANAQDALWQLRYIGTQQVVLGRDDEARIVAEQQRWYDQIERSLAAYANGEHTLEELRALAEWEEVYSQYVAARPRWFELRMAGRMQEAAQWQARTITPAGAAAVRALNRLIALQRAEAGADEQQMLNRANQAVALLTGLTGLAVLIGVGITFNLAAGITRPLTAITGAARAIAGGKLDIAVPVTRADEIGVLATAFNQMQTALRQEQAQVTRQQEALAQRNCELEQTLRQLQDETAAREVMAETLRQVSVPVVPILDQVIVVPLVGKIDEQRAETLMQRLLNGIMAQRAQIAILDITGVPLVDARVADWLINITTAVGLLGTRCLLVGISPQVAEALVRSGADLHQLTTRANLQSAVAYAAEVMGRAARG